MAWAELHANIEKEGEEVSGKCMCKHRACVASGMVCAYMADVNTSRKQKFCERDEDALCLHKTSVDVSQDEKS